MSRGVSDKITYKPYNQGEQWLLPPSLDELVPQNHFVRIVSKTVDELEIEEVFARNTKGGGASRYNPIMLLKVLIYCHMTGTYSSPQKKLCWGFLLVLFNCNGNRICISRCCNDNNLDSTSNSYGKKCH